MPEELNTHQLEAIQRFVSEPLRETVRAEMQAGHEKLASAIEKLGDRLAGHVMETTRRESIAEARLQKLDQRVTTLENFRAKVLVVYTVIALVASILWSLFREWLLGYPPKPHP